MKYLKTNTTRGKKEQYEKNIKNLHWDILELIKTHT